MIINTPSFARWVHRTHTSGGLDDFEIPAFLRRQADFNLGDDIPFDRPAQVKKPRRTPANWIGPDKREPSGLVAYQGWTPAGYAEWLRLNPEVWPDTYAALRAAQLGELVVQWLEFVVGEDEEEALVVQAFNQVITDLLPSRVGAVVSKLAEVIGRGGGGSSASNHAALDTLIARIRTALASLTPQMWPVSVLHFEEDVDA